MVAVDLLLIECLVQGLFLLDVSLKEIIMFTVIGFNENLVHVCLSYLSKKREGNLENVLILLVWVSCVFGKICEKCCYYEKLQCENAIFWLF